MKHRVIDFLGVIVLALLLAVPVSGQDHPTALKAADAEVDPMQTVMEQYMVPGPEHKRLAEFVGEWNCKALMWMEPGGEPMETVGEAVNRLILGGRYLYSEYTSTFMGQPFNGIGITGYDRFNGKYVSMWIDTLSTGMYLSAGTYGAGDNPAEDFGVMDDYLAGGQVKVRNVTTLIDHNTHKFDMYITGPDGKEFKNMEMVYTRKK